MPTCAELRNALAALNLSTDGSKDVLIERLQAAEAQHSGQTQAGDTNDISTANPNNMSYTQAMLRLNVKSATRTSYLNKQKKMGEWALTVPELKAYVKSGLIQGEGLRLMATDPDYFCTFLTWLTFSGKTMPAQFEEGTTLEAKGIETLAAYRKALHKQFEENCIQKSDEYKSTIRTLFSGFARNDAKRRQEEGCTTGKDAMNVVYYKAVGQAALSWPNMKGSLFSHCYLTLCWNLIARTDNIAGILFNHLSVENDHLNVEWYITKTDQSAKKATDKAVYANPFSPLMCPIVSLGMYMMTMLPPESNKHKHMLFPPVRENATQKGRRKQKSRFLKALHTLFERAVSMGFIPDWNINSGAHSLRKGAVSFAAGATTAAPSIVSIILRAGWSLRGVENRYFRKEGAGDQYVGRILAGLDPNSGKFAILPPFFDKRTQDDRTLISGEFSHALQINVSSVH